MARKQKLTSAGTLGALNATYNIDVTEHDQVTVFITGTFTATVTPQVSDDGTNFVPIQGTPLDSSTPVTTIAAAGKGYVFNTNGLKTLQLKVTAYTSGTVNARFAGLTR